MHRAQRGVSNTKLLLSLLLGAITLTALVMYFGMIQPTLESHQKPTVKLNGVYLPTPTTISPFALTDNHNKPFTQDNLKNHWTMMFFGFTNCAMVCPTTMAALNGMYQKLEKELPADKMPQIVFVSVDPERDTVDKINDYMISFNKNFIGTRAEIVDTIALEKQLHIVAAKLQVDGQGKDNYTINHSAEILLFNPDGKLQAYFSYPHDSDELAKEYKMILAL